MRKNKNGVTLIALVITIIILIILAGVSISYVIGDNGLVSNTMKMELDTAKGEVRDHMLLLLNEELLSASAEIVGTTNDIGTKFNEPALVNYLKGNKNYPGTDHEDSGAIRCIEEFQSSKNAENKVTDITPKVEGGTIKSKYRVISSAVCPDGDKYGVGANISDGNIFTLEAVVETEPNNFKEYYDATTEEREKYNGKFQLKYYDKDHNVEVLELVSLYVTNQS